MGTESDRIDRVEKRCVVRLAVQATAHEPAHSVQEALDRLLDAGLKDFTYHVDDLASSAIFSVTPADYRGFIAVLDRAWGDADDGARP